MKELSYNRKYLIISTILSTTTFSLLIIILPLVFFDIQNRKTLLFEMIEECKVNYFYLNFKTKCTFLN